MALLRRGKTSRGDYRGWSVVQGHGQGLEATRATNQDIDHGLWTMDYSSGPSTYCDAQLLQLRAQPVEVEPELAVAQLLARLLFLGETLVAEPRHLRRQSRGTTTTPSTSATITSPGLTGAPAAHAPARSPTRRRLDRPLSEIAFAHTGKSIVVRSATSRTPASMTGPTAPCARADTASRSPNIPSVDSDVVVTTRMSPGLQTSIAA